MDGTTDPVEQEIKANHVAENGHVRGWETILFVEDEGFVREAAREVLQSAGYQVLTAKTAAEAARVYEQSCGEVELLLTDVVLPGETGPRLAQRLREKDPALRVLLITGYAEELGLRAENPEELLAKPFSTPVLLKKVRQLLDCSRIPPQKYEAAGRACDNT
jgi:CheY-like chemotaxis protein